MRAGSSSCCAAASPQLLLAAAFPYLEHPRYAARDKIQPEHGDHVEAGNIEHLYDMWPHTSCSHAVVPKVKRREGVAPVLQVLQALPPTACPP